MSHMLSARPSAHPSARPSARPVALFEDESALDFLPLTFTRPVYDLRCGVFTLAEKWRYLLGEAPYQLALGYQKPLFDTLLQREGLATEPVLFLNGKQLPKHGWVQYASKHLALHDGLFWGEELLAFVARPIDLATQAHYITPDTLPFELKQVQLPTDLQDAPNQPVGLLHLWDLFLHNGAEIAADLNRLRAGRTNHALTDPHTAVYRPEHVFAEANVTVRAAVLDASNGPIYLGEGATVNPGAILQGPVAIGANATVNPGAKIRPGTSIGPWCKVGGEISASILHSYSNKGHDGFLGHSVVGAWCNLGADTNTSNLKNNYGPVKLYAYRSQQPEPTHQTFCGLVMGDHSKCGINTMFNTGTVVGVSANIFGGGFPPKFIPSFSWGGADGLSTFRLEKAFEVAERMMARRKLPFTDADSALLESLFNSTFRYREGARVEA